MANREAGKGDTYRPYNRKKWEEGWERIFGKKKPAIKQYLLNGYEVIEVDRLEPCWICNKLINTISIDFEAPFCCSKECDNSIQQELKGYKNEK